MLSDVESQSRCLSFFVCCGVFFSRLCVFYVSAFVLSLAVTLARRFTVLPVHQETCMIDTLVAYISQRS